MVNPCLKPSLQPTAPEQGIFLEQSNESVYDNVNEDETCNAVQISLINLILLFIIMLMLYFYHVPLLDYVKEKFD